MKKYSKRINLLKKKIIEKSYSCENAIALVKTLGNAKFIESVEAHISLNIDPKHPNQHIRTQLNLPYGVGKEVKIAVLTEEELILETLDMGANIAGSDDLIKRISSGVLNFDILITTPQLMPKLTFLGRILGPKGLMPSLKAGTITVDIAKTIQDFKKGKVEYRTDKNGIVHLNFGKISFSENQLKENLLAIYNSIEKNRPAGIRGKFLKSFYICTTMSPALNLDLNSFKINL